ncbi:trafficking protein particle complex subunit 2-like [Tetranychus urticae]|uniref:Trafficking protein particle complex subunit n=1 Tax=Tetranychus urticae TaxID=32264 RepID=T1KBV6_TETUR|nr:trafficking protein particle complex subunit 2-like [Tetranychus urticae]
MSLIGQGSNYYFVIVGKSDNPIFELEYTTKSTEKSSENRNLSQFIAHSSLDLIDESSFSANNSNMYLKVIDKFNEYYVTAFVCASSTVKFLLLHDANKIEDASLRAFFTDIYEIYCKFTLNTFYELHTPIRSSVFEKKALALAKKYLP